MRNIGWNIESNVRSMAWLIFKKICVTKTKCIATENKKLNELAQNDCRHL